MEKQIWDFLYSKIGNKYGVAGLMGNLYAESGLSPTNMENAYENRLGYNDTTYTNAVDAGSYTNFVHDACGYGLAQWTYYSRKQGLLNYAKSKGVSIGNLNMQLEYLYQELQQSYPGVLNILKNAVSILQASNSVLFDFENPANQSTYVQNQRAEYGQTYYNKYVGTIDVVVSESLTNDNTYTVVAGDTLSGIASKFGTTANYLASLNSITNPNLIYPGQVIRLKGTVDTSTTTYVVKAGDTLSKIAQTYGTTVDYLARINNISDKNLIYIGQVLKIAKNGNASANTYTVIAGDTLSEIAQKYNTTVSELASKNGIDDINKICIGQVLLV